MNKLINFIGWTAGVLLAFCGLPEVISTVSAHHCSLSMGFLLMWLFGEILALIYTAAKSVEVRLFPLIFNYGFNIIFIIILFMYK
jgi:uncharacterized protein with PQ loop repeat